VKNDINVSQDIVAMANTAYQKRRKTQKESLRDGKDLVKLNAEGAAVWAEYEKKKIAMLSQTREVMLKEA
jgi:lysophospholipase L1-like esterase